jgi:cyclophilin family peptidyl-prolyl cis-trans isomerase
MVTTQEKTPPPPGVRCMTDLLNNKTFQPHYIHTRIGMAPSKRAPSLLFASSSLLLAATSLLLLLLPRDSLGFADPALPHSHRPAAAARLSRRQRRPLTARAANDDDGKADAASTRRGFLASSLAATALVLVPSSARASDGGATTTTTATATATTKSTADAVITDRIFVEFKGLSSPSSPGDDVPVDRIVIGLFGDDSPQPVSVLKKLVTKEGYPSKCKPLDVESRTLEKERLEARKVYNSCLETEETQGVNYDYSTVWRVVRDERIDLGAVSGRFVARESPTYVDASASSGGGARLRHDAPGVVSVRRRDGGGFGFTIYPGTGPTSSLDEGNIVVGRVVEGMDVVGKLNDVTVVRSAGAALSPGGRELRGTPSRGCRYGGSEYFCNENKPLRKVLLDRTGLL